MMSESSAEHCAICGSEKNLQPDPNLDEVWICEVCLARRDDHQAAIDHGYDDEEPRIE